MVPRVAEDGQMVVDDKVERRRAKKAKAKGGDDAAALKKAKKLRKKQLREHLAAAAAADDAVQPPASAEPVEKKKKKKKKEQQQQQQQQQGEEQRGAAPGADDGGGASKKRKTAQPDGAAAKAKKTKKSGAAAAAGAGGQEQLETGGAMTDAQVAAFRAERCIAVEGCDTQPVATFAQAGFCADVLHATREFAAPSPIQAQCWPIVSAGRDLVGIAATGSGKTLAFGLPALQRIVSGQGANAGGAQGVTVLVLAPTRELALQIDQVMSEAGARCGVGSVCIYGGVPKREQVAALRAGARVVTGTPGRIQDLMQDGALALSRVDYAVLDEADRMLDLGFEPAVRAILAATAPRRQTLMFSATWPQLVQKLAAEFLRSPVKVTIGSQQLSASHSVTQRVEVVAEPSKEGRLLALLQQYHGSRKNRVIVFVLYKKEAVRMEQLLQRKGWRVAAVHGDLSQAQRTAAVSSFKAGSCPLLLATDVAARGLDIPDVEAVINYSFPLTTEDYVHRIGRTGRAGKTGVAHTLFCGASDKARAGELINVLREANQPVPPELLKFGTTVKKKESKLYGAHFKDVDMSQKASKVTFDDSDEE